MRISRPFFRTVGLYATMAALFAWIADRPIDPERLVIAFAYFVFAGLAASGYAVVYSVERGAATRLTHVVGDVLMVIAIVETLGWFFEDAEPPSVPFLLVIAAIVAPLSYLMMPGREAPAGFVERSFAARGFAAADPWRWALACLIFGAALLWRAADEGPSPPLFLAFWASIAAALLAPTTDLARPEWQNWLRDFGLVALAGLCALSMDGTLP